MKHRIRRKILRFAAVMTLVTGIAATGNAPAAVMQYGTASQQAGETEKASEIPDGIFSVTAYAKKKKPAKKKQSREQILKASAKTWEAKPEKLTAGSAIVMDVNTGAILYQKKINKQRYPASITKIMTTMVALENSSLDDTVKFSKDAIYKTEGSGIARDVGEKMTMEQCLYAVMLESANECAYAVAEHVGGTEKHFVEMMNAKAKELGCTHTHFENPNGLPNSKHVTTAHDMALIAQAAYKIPEFRKLISTTSYKLPKTNKHKHSLMMYNHHRMICSNRGTQYLYKYAVGGKTGFTKAAWNTLVTFVKKGNQTLVVVVLKTNQYDQYKETKRLSNLSFKNFDDYNVSENENRLKESDLTKGIRIPEGKTLQSASIDKNAAITLPAGTDFDQAKPKVSFSSGENPQIVYTYKGHECGTVPVTVRWKNKENTSDTASGQQQKKGIAGALSSFVNTVDKGLRSAGRGPVGTFLAFLASLPMAVQLIIMAAIVVLIIFIILSIRVRIQRVRRWKRRMSQKQHQQRENQHHQEDGRRENGHHSHRK